MNKEVRNARNEFLMYLKHVHNPPRSKYMKKLQSRYDERHKPQMLLPPSLEKEICKAIEKELNKNA